MTADRTRHVIDAIDGCLEDWTVSPDAMRWTPEAEVERPLPIVAHEWIAFAPLDTPPPEPPVMVTYRRIVMEACAELGRVFGRLSDRIAPTIRHLEDVGILPKPLPDDPRERALALQRQRNTGPARPTAAQAKRPRRHG